MQGFISVILAGILLGFVAHEAFHILTISQATRLTIYFGAEEFAVTTCCLAPDESPLEGAAYTIQILVTLGWIWLNRNMTEFYAV